MTLPSSQPLKTLGKPSKSLINPASEMGPAPICIIHKQPTNLENQIVTFPVKRSDPLFQCSKIIILCSQLHLKTQMKALFLPPDQVYSKGGMQDL